MDTECLSGHLAQTLGLCHTGTTVAMQQGQWLARQHTHTHSHTHSLTPWNYIRRQIIENLKIIFSSNDCQLYVLIKRKHIHHSKAFRSIRITLLFFYHNVYAISNITLNHSRYVSFVNFKYTTQATCAPHFVGFAASDIAVAFRHYLSSGTAETRQ